MRSLQQTMNNIVDIVSVNEIWTRIVNYQSVRDVDNEALSWLQTAASTSLATCMKGSSLLFSGLPSMQEIAEFSALKQAVYDTWQTVGVQAEAARATNTQQTWRKEFLGSRPSTVEQSSTRTAAAGTFLRFFQTIFENTPLWRLKRLVTLST